MCFEGFEKSLLFSKHEMDVSLVLHKLCVNSFKWLDQFYSIMTYLVVKEFFRGPKGVQKMHKKKRKTYLLYSFWVKIKFPLKSYYVPKACLNMRMLFLCRKDIFGHFLGKNQVSSKKFIYSRFV